MLQIIIPDLDVIKAYFASASLEQLVDQMLQGKPWFCEHVGIEFIPWSRKILRDYKFPRSSTLHLVGSAANGFSLAPEKAGARFRPLAENDSPSDLDFCLVDEAFFKRIWNTMVREDHLFGSSQRDNSVRIRVYWGRIEEYEVPKSERSNVRTLVDAIRRTPQFRGYKVGIRVYRRHDDLRGYTLSCLRNLRRTIEQ